MAPAPTKTPILPDRSVGEYRYVDTAAGLRQVVAALDGQDCYALDTEFHRERSYWPAVALIQIAWPQDLVIIDPLAVDPSPLASIIDSDRTMVLHAAAQDLEVLEHSCGATPRRIFDTQIAAGFLGMGTPSLAALHERMLGIRIPKTDRLTDWLDRPLRKAQLEYAASDVSQLLHIQELMLARLDELGRRNWAEDECRVLLGRNRGPREPLEAWHRIKEARKLTGRALSVARSVAAWRERHAAAADLPVRFVMSDMAVVAIAAAAPRSREEFANLRGVDRGLAKTALGGQVLEAVASGIQLGWRPERVESVAQVGRGLRPAVGLVRVWVNQLARESGIDPALLATRADIEALIRGDDGARLESGWRAEMAGEPINRLLAGDAALAFCDGGVVLEERTRKPIN